MTKEGTVNIDQTDIRMLERRLRRGYITEKKLAEYLSTLPDVSDNAEEISVIMDERKKV